MNIRLPFEQPANPIIAGDAKLVSMKYFFTRKLMLMKESKAFVCLPGGFGTIDETFELLTLTQTGKGVPVPIVFLETPGDHYWERVRRAHPATSWWPGGSSCRRDLELFTVVRGPGARPWPRSSGSTACTTRCASWATGSCCGCAGSRPTAQLAELNDRFGGIVRVGTHRAHRADRARRSATAIALDLPRLRLRFDKRHGASCTA